MHKKFIAKVEKVEALRFTGTHESAKEISKWVLESVGEDIYVGTTMRDGVEKWDFARDNPNSVDPWKILSVDTLDWRFKLNTGEWLVRRDDDTWNVLSSSYIELKYDDVKDEISANI